MPGGEAAGHLDVEAIGVTVRMRFDHGVTGAMRDRVRSAWTAASVTVDRPDAEISIDSGGDAEVMLERLSVSVTLLALEHRRGDLLMFHAAGIADADGRVVAFVGPSGRGKTTLSRALTPHFEYISDETIGVGVDLAVLPYRKPFSIARPGRPKDQVGPAPGRPERTGSLRLAALVLLDRQPGVVQPVVSRVPIVEALAELVPQTSYLAELDRPLQRLAELSGAVGGVRRVTYSEAETLVRVVEELLDDTSQPAEAWVPMASGSGASPAGNGLVICPVDDAIRTVDALAVISEGRVSILGGIAPEIWAGVRSGLSRRSIVSHVVEVYGSPPSGDAHELVDVAIRELIDAGLVAMDDRREQR